MPHPSTVQPDYATRRIAAFISEAFAPAVLVTVFLVLAALSGAQWPEGALYAALAVFFTTALPLGGVLVLVRRGIVSDHHVSERRQRAPVLAASLVSIACGLVLLVLLDAPWRVTGAVLCTVMGVVVVLLVNLWWKLSAHSAVAVFFAIGGVSLVGAWAGPLLLVPIAVGWARVRLEAHTRAQVIAGSAVGLVIGTVFAVLAARG